MKIHIQWSRKEWFENCPSEHAICYATTRLGLLPANGLHRCKNGHNTGDDHGFVNHNGSNVWNVQFVDALQRKILPWWRHHYSTSGTSSLPISVPSVTNLHGLQLQRHWENMHAFNIALSRSFHWPCHGVRGFHTETIQAVLYMGDI